MMRTDMTRLPIFERVVFAVTINDSPKTKGPTLLNLFTKRDYAKDFITTFFPDFQPMPSHRANMNGELGTVYFNKGAEIHIQTMTVGFGIYQWLIGAEHYRSPIMEAMA